MNGVPLYYMHPSANCPCKFYTKHYLHETSVFVFHGGTEYEKKPDSYEFNFYIVDAREGDIGVEFPNLKPTIRFKGLKSESPRVAFCALDSTLYMFEGDNLYEPRGKVVKAFDGTFAGKFEITPEILAGFDYELHRKDLVRIKPMRERKNFPIAVPTLDGKSILVFSSEFYWVVSGCYDSSFELYNIADNTWTTLPELPKERHCPYSHRSVKTVAAYGFVSDSLSLFQSSSRFMIQFNKELVFVLNLQTMEWERDIAGPSLPWSEGYFYGFDELYFTPTGAYYFLEYGNYRLGFNPPLSEFPDDYDDDPYGDKRYYGTLNPCIALLGDEHAYDNNGAFDIGVVRAQRPSEAAFDSHSFYVMIDICSIDVVQTKRDFQRYQTHMLACEGHVRMIPPELDHPSLKITYSKTRKFLVDVDFSSYVHGVMTVFSI